MQVRGGVVGLSAHLVAHSGFESTSMYPCSLPLVWEYGCNLAQAPCLLKENGVQILLHICTCS
ncbi:hypothetical protein ACRRTK_008912 [Alexandromys fortis]